MLQLLGLTTEAAAVYQAMLDHPGHGVDRLAKTCGLTPSRVHDCLDELGQLMLVRASSEHPGQMRAVDPDVGLAEIMARQEADLAARQAELAASRAAVTRMLADRVQRRSTHGERLLGMDAIHNCLERLCRAARTEIIGVQPGIQSPDDLDAGREHDLAALARGVSMRSLFQGLARRHAHIADYANVLLRHGGEVRTAPTVPQRMVVVDRTHALVPIDPADNRKGALLVTEPGIVSALLELFELAWNTAVPLGTTRPDDPQDGLTDHERELLRLLATGLTDEAVGQRLGVTDRTIRRQVASIMERLGASSRFEAGIKAAQRGWL
ncbi:LuxR C-terminal-related transcriptional regulator [Streptomyces roseicoloratus]|uniref:LuxR C-terminal-related transcriptional regulator n=1 Tax=Streptomyces roseicoloratus TaxID=2508722 RepID=A0ABY9RXT4_9ACTN|nr:LuxR C-terminal-related transcriptional regulator [Streptomyces roseicoloratus]WMX46983.1 LuxR C-terminal-related transcriptional regulator [Streptomyces roseicoloratus]